MRHHHSDATSNIASLPVGNFWRTSQDLHVKRVLFLAIPVNTALFGCEYWAMNESLYDKLSVFYHSTIRRVLGVNMFAVERDRMKNEHLRNKLSVCNITDMVQHHQSNYIRKLARMPSTRLPRRMMGSWLPCKRKPGGVQATTARTYVNTLQAIVGKSQCSDHGHLSDWVYFAESELSWNRTRNEFLSQKRKQCARLGTGTPDPLCMRNGRKQSDLPLSNLHQYPVPHGLSCAA